MLHHSGNKPLSNGRLDSLVGVSPNYFDEADDQGNDLNHALIIGGEQAGSAQEHLISPASGGS